MDKNTLAKIGLSEGEAAVYLTLLENGESPATLIAQKAGLKRPTTYNVLASLIEKNLVQEVKKGKVARFRLQHPVKLKEYFEKIAANAEFAQKILAADLDTLSSQFNLTYRKPGVEYFEGSTGTQAVLNDSLTSKTEILTYADVGAIQKYIPDINAAYVKKRDRLGLKKRGILFDTPFARKFVKDYYPTVTDIRFIEGPAESFGVIMQVYDNKISYLTLSPRGTIGIIIRDPAIYETHRILFESMWATAKR